jgi:hypothetical protein
LPLLFAALRRALGAAFTTFARFLLVLADDFFAIATDPPQHRFFLGLLDRRLAAIDR